MNIVLLPLTTSTRVTLLKILLNYGYFKVFINFTGKKELLGINSRLPLPAIYTSTGQYWEGTESLEAFFTSNPILISKAPFSVWLIHLVSLLHTSFNRP